MIKHPMYLDYNATIPHDLEVIEAMRPYLEEHFGNPSSSHWYGRKTHETVETARSQVATLLNSTPAEVLFTCGGTESNNHAIRGVAHARWGRGNHMMMRNPHAYLSWTALLMAVPFQGCRTASTQVLAGKSSMKLGIVMTTTDPETVFTAFRLANYSVENGDTVSVFLLGKGVELDQNHDQDFDVRGIAKTFLGKGGRVMACLTCLKLRNSGGSELLFKLSQDTN